MHMFIQRAPAAIFACTFMKTLFTRVATADRTLITLIYTIEKFLSQSLSFSKDISYLTRYLSKNSLYKAFRFNTTLY